MKISDFHFITSPHPVLSVEELVTEVCSAGVRWVQLRMKEASAKEFLNTAIRVREITSAYHSTLIINDDPLIALKCNADGVHLGKDDMDPVAARKLLGPDKIIGGTANTIDDVLRLCRSQVDYIGAGPFRYTSTKKNLSPILGPEGIANLVKASSVPVIAIGGLQVEDVFKVRSASAHGIAISGAVTLAADKRKEIERFIKELCA